MYVNNTFMFYAPYASSLEITNGAKLLVKLGI